MSTHYSPKIEEAANPPIRWSKRSRALHSAWIVGLLFIVVSGPITNPVATEELTGPLGRLMAPAHQALFLGHGYRFFAPNPGPSHLLVFRIYRQGELVREGKFPNRDEHWPRVIYHRWFMLSETLFQEHARTPDRESFNNIQNETRNQIDAFRRAGQGGSAEHLEQILDRRTRLYAQTGVRIADLVQSVGRTLLERYGGERIELYIQERSLASPTDVILGHRIDEQRYLSDPIAIGEFTLPVGGAE